MTEKNGITEQINVVVDARGKAREATDQRAKAYIVWLEANQQLFDDEREAKDLCQGAESKLRGLALETYAETKDKAVAPGVGIRVMTKLGYDGKEAMAWAMEHKLALKLDTSNFEKIAKTSNLPFVIITEEPSATIATELLKVKEGK